MNALIAYVALSALFVVADVTCYAIALFKFDKELDWRHMLPGGGFVALFSKDK